MRSTKLLRWWNVLENVGYGLRINDTSRQDTVVTSQRVIDPAGLRAFEHYYPPRLSGGMRQRVNVARALALNPRVLLLDEPIAALDAQTRDIMQGELLRIWRAGRTTILLITHQVDEAVYLSDRVIVFSARPGTVRADIPVDLSRPRSLDVKRSATFSRTVDQIWRLIENEVRPAVATKLPDPHRPTLSGA